MGGGELTWRRELRESDWKIFRKRIPEWRERYLQRKNKEIISVLTDKNKTSTEQFWDAKEKMEEEAKILVDCLDGHSRSKMDWYLLLMYSHGLINNDDLEKFSRELREQVLKGVKVL
ncbi:MAG: hypothetical protein ACXAC5_25395 [Promethearchaeota archaeon]|jgi:hypothetical protein